MRSWLLLFAFAANASALASQRLNTLSVQIDAKAVTVMEYRLWSAHPYVRLKDTWQLGWGPYLDTVHKLADVAQCVRLEFDSKRAVGVWTLPGPKGVALGDTLTLNAPTRTAQNEMWLPLDSVAEVMGYKVNFDAQKQRMSLKSYAYADDNTIPGSCQLFMRARR